MKPTEIIPQLLSHVVAFSVCFAIFVGLPSAAFLIAMLTGFDLREPLITTKSVLLCIGAATLACIALASFVIALQGLRRWLRFSLWVPPAISFPLALAIFFRVDFGTLHSLGAATSLSLLSAGSFCIYWFSLFSSEAILKWFLNLLCKIAEPLSA